MEQKKIIDQLLEAKEETSYYQEQPEQSEKEVKLEIVLAIPKQHAKTELLWILLDKLKKIVTNNGYIMERSNDDKNDYYQVKLDPKAPIEIAYLFMKIKEIVEFSQSLLAIKEVHLLFSRKKVTDYDKTHKRLLTFMLEKSQYFQTNTIFIWNYRTYLKRQMDMNQGLVAINYLKRNEIEIKNIRIDITPIELENLMQELLSEFYDNSCHFFRRKIRNRYIKREEIHQLMNELKVHSAKREEANSRKVLVYSLDRRTPVLLNLSSELEQLLKEEEAKTLG